MTQQFEAFLAAEDPEQEMRQQLEKIICQRRKQPPDILSKTNRLRILLAGYAGADNTGADVRLIEIIKQLPLLFVEQKLEVGVMSLRTNLPSALKASKIEVIEGYFPEYLVEVIERYDIVIVGEGSVFTSSFCDTFAVMMTATLGYAQAAGKPAIAYGVEADKMTPSLIDFVQKNVGESLLIARNQASLNLLQSMGLKAYLGTDTAWTFVPQTYIEGKEKLPIQNFTAEKPLLVVCPHNPFWWPVKPDITRGMLLKILGQSSPKQYNEFYFHHESEIAERNYQRYLNALKLAIELIGNDYSIAIIGMECIDTDACQDLAALISLPTKVYIAGEDSLDWIVTVLRQAALVISSRFHGLLLSMAAGVPSCGLAMDSRIPNLLSARKPTEAFINSADDELAIKLKQVLPKLLENRHDIENASLKLAATEIRRFADMGQLLVHEVQKYYSWVAVQDSEYWQDWLPTLSTDLKFL